jgi:hypothetical protein
MDDSLELKRETISIEGGRNLYSYTFSFELAPGSEGQPGSAEAECDLQKKDVSSPPSP